METCRRNYPEKIDSLYTTASDTGMMFKKLAHWRKSTVNWLLTVSAINNIDDSEGIMAQLLVDVLHVAFHQLVLNTKQRVKLWSCCRCWMLKPSHKTLCFIKYALHLNITLFIAHYCKCSNIFTYVLVYFSVCSSAESGSGEGGQAQHLGGRRRRRKYCFLCTAPEYCSYSTGENKSRDNNLLYAVSTLLLLLKFPFLPLSQRRTRANVAIVCVLVCRSISLK